MRVSSRSKGWSIVVFVIRLCKSPLPYTFLLKILSIVGRAEA